MKIAIRQHDRRCCVEFFFFVCVCILSPLHFTNTEWGPGMLTVMYQNIIARFRTSNISNIKKKYRSKIHSRKMIIFHFLFVKPIFFFFLLFFFFFIYGRLHIVCTRIDQIHSKFRCYKKILNYIEWIRRSIRTHAINK